MQIISTEKAPGAIGPYSQGYVVGGFVYTSGQIPVNPADGSIPEGIAAQAEQSCANVGAILEAAGTGFEKVFKTTCFLADMADFAAFNEVYAKYFISKPARSCVAAKAAFEVIAEALPTGGKNRLAVVIATVEGDIHDIGKNIVKLLLENYGFAVSDLGRDVKPEVILAEVKRLAAPICALSALMTTTVPAMVKTVELIKSEAPFCQVIVGGAVLTREYADAIGADFYGKDAMSAVRYAEKLEEKLGAAK